MEQVQLEKLRYPTGKFSYNPNAAAAEIKQWIAEIEQLPAKAKAAVRGLSDSQLDTPYREEGWTVRQVIHHMADSHVNAFIRTKFALTENHPTIKPYEETIWADLADGKRMPAEASLILLEGLHARWAFLLKSLTAEDFRKTCYHPESGRDMSVAYLLQLYTWHGRHHCAHITSLRERMKW